MTAAPQVLTFADVDTLADLATYIGRAKWLDPSGAARLVGHGDVLACYVCPVFGAGGPTVLGLRTLSLAVPGTLDVTVPLAALTDRFARDDGGPGHDATLSVPPSAAQNAPWAGVAPPRRGWEPVGLVPHAVLAAAAAAGIGEVAAGTPPGAGSAAVAALRGRVWGVPLADGTSGAPRGLAFVADGLGFTRDGEPAALYRCGAWTRLTTSAGHVLARSPML